MTTAHPSNYTKGRTQKIEFLVLHYTAGRNDSAAGNLHISRCAPECPREPPEPLVCSDYERCRHCNYMAHGFQCDHGNGSCVLTDMEEINGRRRILVQSIAEK